MTDEPAKAIVPQNATEKNILEILGRLKSGEPLGSIDTFGVLRPITHDAKRNIKNLVNISRKEGRTARREIIWITAQRGGGKTEALAAIEKELLVENYAEGFGKSIVVPVDLKQVSQSTTGSGLQAIIFEKATTTSSSPFKQKIDELTRYLTTGEQSQKARENLIGLGVDVALSLANVAAPGVSTGVTLLGTGAVGGLIRRWKLREKNIQKLLREKGIISPEAISLLTKWIRYSIQPDQEHWKELEQVFQPLADREILFPILCIALQASGYSTIVLLFDEVDQLLGGTTLTRAFERLWDPPKESDYYNHKLNIFFILAGTAKVDDLKNEELYAGFSRRFMGAKTAPITINELSPPSVHRELNINDDCAHAMSKVRELLGGLTEASTRNISPEEEIELRRDLAELSDKEQLTWYDLWAAVCRAYSVR